MGNIGGFDPLYFWLNNSMSGIQVNNNGILLSSNKSASRAFGITIPSNSSTTLSAIPRLKFNYYADFALSTSAVQMMHYADLNTWTGSRGLSFKIKTIDKPKITLVTKELNQYNKKHLVYTGVEYGEASIRLHDTVEDSVLAFWIDYFTYYFADSRAVETSKDSSWNQSPVSTIFNDDTGWGFRPISEETSFFTSIRIWALFNQTYTRFRYVNPKITAIDWQNNDSSSSETDEVTITFKYEGIVYEECGQSLFDLESDILAAMNLGTLTEATSTIPRKQPRLFSNTSTSSISLFATGARTSNTGPDVFGNGNAPLLPFSTGLTSSSNATVYSLPNSAVIGTAGRSPLYSGNISAVAKQLLSGTTTYTKTVINQQLSQRSGLLSVSSNSGGYQYVEQTTGNYIGGPTVSNNQLLTPISPYDPVISAASVAAAIGAYSGQNVPYQIVESVAAVAAYTSAVVGIPVTSLFVNQLVSLELIESYNTFKPKGSQVGVFATASQTSYENDPTLRGCVQETHYDRKSDTQ